jgi:hypothetical protein
MGVGLLVQDGPAEIAAAADELGRFYNGIGECVARAYSP